MTPVNRWLLATAAAYLALLPSNAWTALRSIAFGAAAAFALLVVLEGVFGRGPRVPTPGRSILITLGLWCAWSVASLAWSINPEYTTGQLKREIAWSLLAMMIFFVAPGNAFAWRVMLISALGAFAVYSALALGLAATPAGWDAARWHAGVGPYSTHVVLVAPLLLTLFAPAPVGFGNRARALVTGLALLILLLASARLTDNRMVWIALATVFAVASGLAAWRWRATLARAPLRWSAPLFALLVVLAALFVDVARERAHVDFPQQTSVAETLAEDPRLGLWDHTLARIRDRPWTGYGFGRAILADELKSALGNPMLWHAHNVFASQCLQTGLIGLALFVAVLGTLVVRLARFIGARDDMLAFVGIVGLALIAGFVVKNLTDDFLFRNSAKEFWALLALLLGFGTRIENGLPSDYAQSASTRPDSG